MNEQQWLKSLDRNDATPDIDVATSVLRTLRLRGLATSVASDSPNPLTWPALFAMLAGSGAALIAFQTVAAFQDPFTGFLDAFKLVLQ
jgi:hypothetical protein